MKRLASFFLIALVSVGLLLAFFRWRDRPNSDQITKVAAVFPVTIDAFESFRISLEESARKRGVTVVSFSAEGDASKFDSIIERALSENPNILVTVGTQLTNSAFGPQFKNDLPIVVATCISTPEKVEALEEVGLDPPRNRPVAIISDSPKTDIYAQSADLLAHMLAPGSLVGILSNEGELNSKTTAQALGEAFIARGLAVERGLLSNASDVAPVTESLLLRAVKCIVIPHDKAATMEASTVVKLAMEADRGPVPVFSLDNGTVRKNGATVAVSVGYASLGSLTGDTCITILDGADPSKMAINRPEKAGVFVNRESLEKCGISIKVPYLAGATAY